MSYNMHRCETLRRLGIEQLPAMLNTPEWDEPRQPMDPFSRNLPVRTMPVRIGVKQFTDDVADARAGSRPPLPELPEQRTNCLGHPGEALPSVRHGGQLRRLLVSCAILVTPTEEADVRVGRARQTSAVGDRHSRPALRLTPRSYLQRSMHWFTVAALANV